MNDVYLTQYTNKLSRSPITLKCVIKLGDVIGVSIRGQVRFGATDSALDISSPDISVPGLSGARTFFFDSLFYSYVVSLSTAFKKLPASLFFLNYSKN